MAKQRRLRPRITKIKGHDTVVHPIAVLADAIGFSCVTIRYWEQRGLIPPPTYLDASSRRWYSDDYIKALKRALDSRGAAAPGVSSLLVAVESVFGERGKAWRRRRSERSSSARKSRKMAKNA